MLAPVSTICETNGMTKHVVITCDSSVSDMLWRALFNTDIVGLQCMDTKLHTEVFNVCCTNDQYAVILQEHFI
ncbi:unnamed protein product [Rotaria sp. Silwood1]|nr:unnamed protein product [Rotaria sp. Silwood1]